MTRMTTGTILPTLSSTSKFDIVQRYNSLLSSEPDLTPPIAAIESLIAALTASPATTISETLDLLQTSATTLRQAVPNWIALSAGTDLFQRYLVTTLQRPGALGPGGDFGLLKQHLLSNSRLFVQRAKEARGKIAKHGSPFIRNDMTILTNGGSRVVCALLRHAAETSGRYFRVIYVSPLSPADAQKTSSTIATLRSLGIPVAVIPESAVAFSLATTVDMVLVGAEGVVENGGIISRLGTYQMALLAHSMNKAFYVASESYKFVRMYPLGQEDLPIEQNILKFETATDAAAGMESKGKQGDMGKGEAIVPESRDYMSARETTSTTTPTSAVTATTTATATSTDAPAPMDLTAHSAAVDYTPPNLISALITENGILTPSAVSEEVIKLWF